MSDGLLDDPRTRDAAVTVPRFPSESYPALDAWQLADERRLWNTLVSAGLGREHANSFLVVATQYGDEGTETRLWPEDQLTRFFNTRGRIERFATEVAMVRTGEDTVVVHRALLSDRGTPTSGSLTLLPDSEPYVEGSDLTQVLVSQPMRRAAFLAAWRRVVIAAHDGLPGGDWLIDAVPRNVRVDADGQLHLIDQEWVWRGECSVDAIVRRGVFLFVLDLVEAVPATDAGLTVRAMAEGIGVDMGLDGDWIDQAIAFEAELQCLVGGVVDGDGPHRRQEIAQALLARFASPVVDVQRARSRVPGPVGLELGARIDRLAVSEEVRTELERERADLRAEINVLRARLEETSEALARHERRAVALGDEVVRLQEHNQELERMYHEVLEQLQVAVTSRGWQMLESMRRFKGRIPRP